MSGPSTEQVKIYNLANDIRAQLEHLSRRVQFIFYNEKAIMYIERTPQTIEYLTYMKSELNDANEMLKKAEALQQAEDA